MASYTAPTENLPIFDPSVFINDLTPITVAEGDKRYLRFPFAQGTENLTDINVGGTSTFSGAVAFTQLPTCSDVPSLATQLVNKAYVDALPPPTADNLTAVLTAGDNAGGLNITNLNNLQVSTINSLPYPPTPTADNLTAVLTAGDDAGGLNITNLNQLTTTGTTNFGGATNNFNTAGINQTDSSFINTNTSTLSYTQIGGGTIGVADGTATAVVDINNTTIGINDTSAGTDNLIITKNSIAYTNDTGNGQQLLISSTNDLPLNIEATTGVVGQANIGINIKSNTTGNPIIIEATTGAVPATPAYIQLQTCDASTLGNQSSILLETDNVFVINGSMRLMSDPLNYLSGLSINEATANNFQIVNNAGNLNVGTSATASVLTLQTKDNVAGSGAGLAITGNTVRATTAGGASGSYLALTIQGTVYKIALLNA